MSSQSAKLMDFIFAQAASDPLNAIEKAINGLTKVVKAADDSSGTTSFVTALVGAFAGAVAAYIFERSREKRSLRESRHAVINETLLKLLYHGNSLANIDRQFLAKFRDDTELRHAKLGRCAMLPNSFKIETERLSFFLERKGFDPNLFQDLYLAQASYENVFNSISIRNAMAEDILESARSDSYIEETNSQRIAVDPRLVRSIQSCTDQLYLNHADATARVEGLILRLRTEGKRMFPKMQFLNWVLEKPITEPS